MGIGGSDTLTYLYIEQFYAAVQFGFLGGAI